LRLLAALLGESDTGATFRALIGNAHLDAAFGERFRGRYVDAQCRRNRGMLERGIERGQLPADLDVDVEADQLVGRCSTARLSRVSRSMKVSSIGWRTAFLPAFDPGKANNHRPTPLLLHPNWQRNWAELSCRAISFSAVGAACFGRLEVSGDGGAW
jgi:Tetracyclin repressor-like, C-terminal domain